MLAQNGLSKGLEPLADSATVLTVRGQLFKKGAGKQKKSEFSAALKLVLLEVRIVEVHLLDVAEVDQVVLDVRDAEIRMRPPAR